MEKLKPCPFCGGEAVESFFSVGCLKCDVWVSADNFEDDFDWHSGDCMRQAIKLWNTRAERTCNMTWHYSDNGGSAYTCSNCGRDTYPFNKSFEHCPHCTANVVS